MKSRLSFDGIDVDVGVVGASGDLRADPRPAFAGVGRAEDAAGLTGAAAALRLARHHEGIDEAGRFLRDRERDLAQRLGRQTFGQPSSSVRLASVLLKMALPGPDSIISAPPDRMRCHIVA